MSFLVPQSLVLNFVGGLSSKTDALQIQPPNYLEMQNARFDKLGQLNKRNGYDILTTNVIGGSTITEASAIDSFNDELNLFDNQNIYTYVESNKNWANRGTAISLINQNNQIIRNASQQLNPDSAFLNNIEVYAWEDSRGGIRLSALDHQTRSYVQSDQLVYQFGSKPKLIEFNNLIYIFYTDQNYSLYYRTINPTNPGVITTQQGIVADGYQSFNYDVQANANQIFISYAAQVAGVSQVKLFSMNQNNSLNSAITISTGAQAFAINNSLDSLNHIWISWATSSEVRIACYTANATPTVILSDSLVDSVAAATLTGIESIGTPGLLQLTYEIIGNIPSNQSIKSQTVSTTGVITLINQLLSVGLASKAFRYNQNLYVNLAHQSTLQSTYFTILLSNFVIVSKVSPQVGGGLQTNGMLPEVNEIDPNGIFQLANLVKGQFISEDNVSFSLLGVNSTTIDFTNNNKFNSLTFSNNLLFVGGILQSYEGVSVVEQGFHINPENITAEVFDTGGALSVGQYQYQFVYAWSDNFGQIQYSGPSIPITVTTTSATSSVLLSIDTCRLTSKTNVIIKGYRTQADQTTFQEVTSELFPLQNNPNVNQVIFIDVAADVNIAGNQPIYTTGGVLPNQSPPSCSLISYYQDRVVLGGLEDNNLLWFSKNKSNNSNSNTIPVEFSTELTIGLSELGGDTTAITQMDNALVIFKESAIYVMTGDGPNDTGGGDSFSSPQLVSNTIGCNNPNSVKLIKDGVVFQSEKGIWLLPRGLDAPSFIGAPVDESTKQFQVSSVTEDPNDNLIIFTTFNGPALVYDYYNQQWVTWTNHQAEDSIVFGNVFTYVRSNGQVYQQNRSKFTDGTAPIYLEFITPWLSISQIMGYQAVFRAFILGTYKGPHQLNVSIGYDFNPAFNFSTTINATSLAGSNVWGSDGYWGNSTPWGGLAQPYQFQINFNQQRCTSFRLKISDSQSSNYNEGYAISNINIEVGQTQTTQKLPVSNKSGTK